MYFHLNFQCSIFVSTVLYDKASLRIQTQELQDRSGQTLMLQQVF